MYGCFPLLKKLTDIVLLSCKSKNHCFLLHLKKSIFWILTTIEVVEVVIEIVIVHVVVVVVVLILNIGHSVAVEVTVQ